MKRMRLLPHDEYLKQIREPDSVLVCSTGTCSLFPDSICGNCHDCGCEIHYRPYSKDAAVKICTDCAMKRIDRDSENNGIT